MTFFFRVLLLIPLVLFVWMGSGASAAYAMQVECSNQQSLEHAFDSGATWSLCVDVDDNHGLTISSLNYRAPGDFSRPVLQQINLGQLLLHYHDEPLAREQITPVVNTIDGESVRRTIAMSAATCDGQVLSTPELQNVICSRIKDNRTLAKYAQRPSLQSQSWELSAAFRRNSLTWTTAVTLTEDGTIRPQVSLSGRLYRTSTNPLFAAQPTALQSGGQAGNQNGKPLARATVLATWRAVFNLDSNDADQVEQYEFELDVEQGNRRPMRVTAINTETLQQVNPSSFRGWRVFDSSGSGYYLDPANSGHRYVSRTNNWAQFDVGFSAFNPCEHYSLLNRSLSNEAACGDTLDDFINGESLSNRRPVLWYSQSRSLSPSQEHWPIIADVALTFDLLPFDWTASSPFEVIE